MAIECPKCQSNNWHQSMRHPSRPDQDTFLCKSCSHVFKRYDPPVCNTPKEPQPQPQLDQRELATVLAALRHWQEAWAEQSDGPMREHFADHTPLDGEEIDALCERLNGSEVSELDDEGDEQCPECQRSFGPHYTGPCSH